MKKPRPKQERPADVNRRQIRPEKLAVIRGGYLRIIDGGTIKGE